MGIVHGNQLSAILKARQLGMTWCCLAYALWQMIFRPIASVLIFSKRDVDAIYLLSEDRLRGMYDRLPEWMKNGHEIVTNNAHEWSLANGSTARSFPTNAGDSYTATFAMVDEADLSPDLNSLLRSVKPTIDNGGKMVLLSRSDKSSPVSDFKKIYTNGVKGVNGWATIFLPWWTHPGRTQAWYEAQKADIESRTGSLDDLYEQYPATPEEALIPRQLDKRIPIKWLTDIYEEVDGDEGLGLPGLTVYQRPGDRRLYVIGADPAEGNPNSDESSATVLDLMSGEEVATLSGKLQPSTFADYIMKLARFFNDASVLVERNNHGHAVLLKMAEDGFEGTMNGHDPRPGWHNTTKGKALMYHHTTDTIKNKEVKIHSSRTYIQLASIEGNTLKAPEGLHDDAAVSFALACCGRVILLGGDVGMVAGTVAGRDNPEKQEEAVLRSMGVNPARQRPTNSTIRTVKVIRTSKRVSHGNPALRLD